MILDVNKPRYKWFKNPTVREITKGKKRKKLDEEIEDRCLLRIINELIGENWVEETNSYLEISKSIVPAIGKSASDWICKGPIYLIENDGKTHPEKQIMKALRKVDNIYAGYGWVGNDGYMRIIPLSNLLYRNELQAFEKLSGFKVRIKGSKHEMEGVTISRSCENGPTNKTKFRNLTTKKDKASLYNWVDLDGRCECEEEQQTWMNYRVIFCTHLADSYDKGEKGYHLIDEENGELMFNPFLNITKEGVRFANSFRNNIVVKEGKYRRSTLKQELNISLWSRGFFEGMGEVVTFDEFPPETYLTLKNVDYNG